MRIALDLDGVVYQWDKTARYMLRPMRGYENASPLKHESPHWNHIEESVNPEDWDSLWHEGVELGLFRYGHMVKGCRIGLQELVGAGHGFVHRARDDAGADNAHFNGKTTE